MKKVSIRTIAVLATILIILLAAVEFGLHHPLSVATGLNEHNLWITMNVIAWVVGAGLTARLVQILGWNRVGRKTGRYAPYLLVQITNILIYFVAALGMAGFLFKVPLTGAIATSSVIGLVIGFALKSLISDTFSGIALNLDQGFGISDSIQLIGRGGATRIIGQVTQINWRSTYVLNAENAVMVIPNTVVSESIVVNLSRPGPVNEFELAITIDFEVPSDRVIRVLTAAAYAASRENPAIHDCKVRISEFTAAGTVYKIIYMLDPGILSIGKAKHILLDHAGRQMTMTGLSPAHGKVDNWDRVMPEMHQSLGDAANRLRLLGKVHLFKDIDAIELAGLAERMSQRLIPAGRNVITVDEPGQSMFVLSEGLMSVRIEGQDGEIEVATLSAGDFFGEMSLLTGEPRSTSILALTETVAFEIDKQDLLPLLDANPAAAEMLSIAIAERRVATHAAGIAKPVEEVAAERASLSAKILSGMARFLGLRSNVAEMVRA